MNWSLSPSRTFAPRCTGGADLEKERRELKEEVADFEREGRGLQEELDRRDDADADISAAFVELCNALGDRVVITFCSMRLRLTLEVALAQQLGVPPPWVNR